MHLVRHRGSSDEQQDILKLVMQVKQAVLVRRSFGALAQPGAVWV